jgi:hypothetical protein
MASRVLMAHRERSSSTLYIRHPSADQVGKADRAMEAVGEVGAEAGKRTAIRMEAAAAAAVAAVARERAGLAGVPAAEASRFTFGIRVQRFNSFSFTLPVEAMAAQADKAD